MSDNGYGLLTESQTALAWTW